MDHAGPKGAERGSNHYLAHQLIGSHKRKRIIVLTQIENPMMYIKERGACLQIDWKFWPSFRRESLR